MKLILTSEQKELASSVARFLADTSPMSRVREIAESAHGHDPAVWTRLSTELGLPALAIPETYGGAGYGRTEVCVVMEALGAALTPTPYFASAVLAAEALLHQPLLVRRDTLLAKTIMDARVWASCRWWPGRKPVGLGR